MRRALGRRLLHLLLLAAVFAARVQACECIAAGTVHDAFVDSTVVVTAEAISVSTASARTEVGGETFDAETQTVEWNVLESWKGPYAAGQTFTTRTVIQCCLCGRAVVAGSRMLLYLHGIAPYKISTCGRTAELKEGTRDIPELKALRSRRGGNDD